ncbi:MAG: hypothetical protein DRP67_01790 [Candidatus Omnitrophota bacterium]|nr:MAG: hypothetical protein DRP67_01790 [Candidatus Omnitrophota bacterium]
MKNKKENLGEKIFTFGIGGLIYGKKKFKEFLKNVEKEVDKEKIKESLEDMKEKLKKGKSCMKNLVLNFLSGLGVATKKDIEELKKEIKKNE